uniref:Uncharacterized protein n=1 Tax=Anguilla anguilla TaxID=7936 RepID=A0A0E9TVM7_ANGAN
MVRSGEAIFERI